MIHKKLTWPALILRGWKGSIQRHHREIKRLGRSVSQRRMPREPEKLPLTMIVESQLMEQVLVRKIKTNMERRSLTNFEGFCTYTHRTDNEGTFFCQDGHGVMNVDFSRQSFFPTDF